MYTYANAVKILNYYSDKVVGFPIDESHGKSLLVDSIRIDEYENHTFNVNCVAIGTQSVHFFRDVYSVAKDLGLPLPDEILEQ